MRIPQKRACLSAMAVLVLSPLGWVAHADEEKGDSRPTGSDAQLVLDAASMDDSVLAGLRAGTQVSSADLQGAVGGNSASGTVSGSNIIGSGAFSNSSGLPVVIQNSGNNVLIQSSTVVNVQVK
jgi:hypothetical protein